MIGFFRKIRKKLADDNKPAKYFRYAIGEIVLVVIGILIALSINNWNEERKGVIKECAVLDNLAQDLTSDSISYNKNHKTLTDIKSLYNNLFKIGVNGENNIVIEKPNYIRRTLYYNPITIENNPFVSDIISNDEIRQEILDYYRYAKNMDNSYSEFKDVIHNRMRVFLGQKQVHNLSSWFNNQNSESGRIISNEDLVSLSKLPEFQQLLLEASIKLSEVTIALEILIDQNDRLKETIKRVLEN